METRSIADKTLFFWHIVFFVILASAMSVLFLKIDYWEKIANGSAKHILLGLGYVGIFIIAPLVALSWMLNKFIVSKGEIEVVYLFGLVRKRYLLPTKKNVSIKQETAP